MEKQAVDFVIQYLWECPLCGDNNIVDSMPQKGEDVDCQSCDGVFAVGQVIEHC